METFRYALIPRFASKLIVSTRRTWRICCAIRFIRTIATIIIRVTSPRFQHATLIGATEFIWFTTMRIYWDAIFDNKCNRKGADFETYYNGFRLNRRYNRIYHRRPDSLECNRHSSMWLRSIGKLMVVVLGVERLEVEVSDVWFGFKG